MRRLAADATLEAGYLVLRNRDKAQIATVERALVDLDPKRRAAAKKSDEHPVADRIIALVDDALAGRFDVDPRQCDDWCPYRTVCRYYKTADRERRGSRVNDAMARVELTAEQRDAVYAAGNVLVRAGAGSGKTEVLAQRFVALLAGDIAGREPLAPERIAAITFTEKATADMRRRIAEVLDDRIAREGDAARRTALVRARRTLGLARISTIHAFCARMLREYPIEAGVDPGFEVLDEYQSMTFLEGAGRELIADAVRSQHPGAMRLVGARGLYGFTHQNGRDRRRAAGYRRDRPSGPVA